MNGEIYKNLTRRVIHWLLFAVIIIYVISGLGITEYRIVESLTFGLLTKSLAFKIHDILLIPCLVLLSLHICFSFILKNNKSPQ